MAKQQQFSYEAFTQAAIKALRTERSRGIHTVFSGFNSAFKKQFPDADPVAVTNQLAKDGKIDLHPVRGGVMIYLPGEDPRASGGDTKGQRALAAILANFGK